MDARPGPGTRLCAQRTQARGRGRRRRGLLTNEAKGVEERVGQPFVEGHRNGQELGQEALISTRCHSALVEEITIPRFSMLVQNASCYCLLLLLHSAFSISLPILVMVQNARCYYYRVYFLSTLYNNNDVKQFSLSLR